MESWIKKNYPWKDMWDKTLVLRYRNTAGIMYNGLRKLFYTHFKRTIGTNGKSQEIQQIAKQNILLKSMRHDYLLMNNSL